MIRNLVVPACLMLGMFGGAVAEELLPPPKVLLAKEALSGVDGKESYLLDIDWPAHSTTGRHIHAGDEYATVIEGELQLNVEGQPPKTVKAGEAYHNPAGFVHETRNVGDRPARSVALLVIQKGRPPPEPVK